MSDATFNESNHARVLLITGASRGIGAATARLAAERGYRVCVNYRANREAADALAHSITSAGGRAIAVGADIASEAEVARLFKTCDDALGPLWGLVNNAGVLEQQQRVDDMESARLQRVFATNVLGAFACAREAVRRMSTKHGGQGGVIVNVSSVAARLGSPGEYVDYAASKGAIDTFTVGLAAEVAQEGIRVNAVRPGFIYTEMHASGGEPNRVDRLKAFIPMKRGGTAMERCDRTTLAGWQLTDDLLALEGEHPAFGAVTLRQLLATWVVHDLGHVAQCARVMAKQYRDAIGPWREYLPIVDR